MEKLRKIRGEKGEGHLRQPKVLENYKSVAGVDEVGRGSLFGPVFAGAVVLNDFGKKYLLKAGLKDSKKLTKKKIKELEPLIKSYSLDWGLGQASAREIDELGIRYATEKAMIRALQRLSTQPDIVLVDGNLPIRKWENPQKTIVKGDNLYPEIAASSVLAKSARDSLIKRLSINFPEYKLDLHVGYGTKLHRDAIIYYGPSKLHRQSFLSNLLPSKY